MFSELLTIPIITPITLQTVQGDPVVINCGSISAIEAIGGGTTKIHLNGTSVTVVGLPQNVLDAIEKVNEKKDKEEKKSGGGAAI
jgi:hypothetical protein